MTEKELLNKIKKSADSIEIPDSITPEEINSRLHTKENKKNARHRLPIYSMERIASAAAVLLLCTMLSASAWQLHLNTYESSEESAVAQTEDEAYFTQTSDSTTDEIVSNNKNSQTVENETTTSSIATPRQDAGSLYTVAKSYDQIYELLQESSQIQRRYSYDTGIEDSASIESGVAENATSLQSISQSKKESSSYSTTNLQTAGVDESDRVKTDGRYIYTVTGSKILITDTKDGHLSSAGSISPDLQSCDSILEFYVDNDKLILLVQHYDTAITDCAKSYSMDTKASTMLSTYDITNPKKPVLEGTVAQDGFYNTSRKIGDIVYLFTNQELTVNTLSPTPKGELLPCINGEAIPCDSIYLPNEGSNSLILSSVNVNKSSEIVDKIMIIHNFVNIYVGNDSIYLYQTDYGSQYHQEEFLTEIAGFSMKEGILNAISAASMKGEIFDTFAIHESKQGLQVLTTSYDADGISSNNLYLLDKNMELTASLTDMAKGEEIYAARYFDNTAYFITYRNTDPLFAVDISDYSNPKLLGELEVTGFSEYLHFWEQDKLLGIGYETDDKSGDIQGLKLVMFDISDPVDLKVIDTLVLENYIYSPALYNYKCVLTDSDANLIGFAGEYQNNLDEYAFDYLLYSWEDNHFIQRLCTPLSNHISYDYLRGIYIDNKFFIADFNEIMSFDRENQYEKTDVLTLK